MGVPLKKVAVIGGGLAGLSAASRLAEAGLAVTLFEAAPQLGGRARTVHYQGHILDNGQHILLGAYHQTLDLMASVGLDQHSALLRLPLALNMHGCFSLKAKRLPAPLHLLFGLLAAQGLRWHERLAAIRFFIYLNIKRFKLASDQSVLSLLEQQHQPTRLIKWLWEPLCLAAMNTPIQSASAQTFINVLRDSFNQSKSDSDLLLPRLDLSALLADPIAQHIKQRGGEIKLNTSVDAIEQSSCGFNLKLVGGQSMAFSHVIIATSPALTKAISHQLAIAKDLAELSYQPIYTVYLQYPSHVKLKNVMTGFTQGLAQWAFDRGQLTGQHGLIAVIISAQGAHQTYSQQALAEAISQELKQAFADLPAPLWHKVIAEKRATFACEAGMKRPAQKTNTPNLYLAGDYTEGDYPATIEGAIASGVSAAQLVIQS
ncbi:MAG: hydroxysqualene dehydroxylase HpnE [Candidatus Methylopumilus sp.]